MKYFNGISKSSGEMALFIVFIVFILMDYRIPQPIASWIDTLIGKAIVVLCAVALFFVANPLLGVLGLFVAYELIRRSMITTGSLALSLYNPSENKKYANINAMNQFPITLEEEMVEKMAPSKMSLSLDGQYQPLMDNTYDAEVIEN